MNVIKHEHDEEQQAFLSPAESPEILLSRKPKRSRAIFSYVRIALEIAMATAVVALLIWPIRTADPTPIKRTPVPSLPKKLYTFVPNPRYLHEDMFVDEDATLHRLHNWIELSSASRGYVQFKDWDTYQVGEPYEVKLNHTHDGPGYMMSAFHQLHCLSYIVQHYQAGYGGVELTQEVAHHSAHCFDYLRQSLMCAADTSLEGKTDAGPGWGSEHECTDYDALLGWANHHATYKWKLLMPNTAVL